MRAWTSTEFLPSSPAVPRASARPLLAARGAHVVVGDLQDNKGKSLGSLRVLVNSARIGWATRVIGKDGRYESAHDLDPFRKVIEINLVGTLNCIRIAATAMSTTELLADGERGAIVTMASVAAFEQRMQAPQLLVVGGAESFARIPPTHTGLAPGAHATAPSAAQPAKVGSGASRRGSGGSVVA